MLTMPDTMRTFGFDNSYARLPERFYASVMPTSVAAPRLVKLNGPLADMLGLDPGLLASPEGVAILAGNSQPADAEPLAMAYAGHQFGGFVPQLGDGRAVLLGEIVDRDGVRRDIQLKGAGPTPFSRRGDGRAALGPVLREYIVSEAFAALGIPTTRALAAVTTGETVRRETPLPGAILTRVASSHIRVGTFQFFAARQDVEGVRALADYVIARHYPDAASEENPYLGLLTRVIHRQAALLARWMSVGFIHGVMNTDNMSIAGETIDFGPCAFMDSYHPATVYSFIDEAGRYAYANQPRIGQWNLTRFAETLLPLLADDKEKAVDLANEAIAGFAPDYEAALAHVFGRKIGLFETRPGDLALGLDLLQRMAESEADFTLTFRRLGDAAEMPEADSRVRGLFSNAGAYDDWAGRWRDRLAAEPMAPGERRSAMNSVNPAVIPRNHLVEEVIVAAVEGGDFEPFDTLVEILAQPYDDVSDDNRFSLPPRPEQVVRNTFCGT
jgi:uncharacterized protein YdiU (UPF0061 family)